MNRYGKFLNNRVFDLDYVGMCLVENVSLCLWLQTYNNEPKVDFGNLLYLSPKQLFQISCQYSSVANFLLSVCRQQYYRTLFRVLD